MPPNICLDVAFNPAGTSIGVVHSLNPDATVYPWTTGTGFGTKYANPSTGISGGGNCLSFSLTGNVIGIGSSLSPGIQVYTWSSSTGFGSKYADPGLPANPPVAVSFI